MSTSQAKITLSAEDRASRIIGQVREQMARASEQANELTAAAGFVGPAFASIAGAAGVVALVKNMADAADALNDVADATGASVEALSGLERVARLNGGTLDDVAGILVKFNAALKDAGKADSDAARIFQALGLSVADLRRQDPAKALQATAVALSQWSSDGDKARATQELFGKSIREAAPYLNDLATAGRLQATTTTEQAAAAEKFNKELFRLRTNAEEARRALVNGLLPAINDLFDRYRSGGVVRAIGLDGFTDRVAEAANALRLLGLARDRITPLSVLEKDPTNPRALQQLAEIDAKAKALGETFKKSRQEYLGLTSQAGAGRGVVNPELVKPDLKVPDAPSKKTKQDIDENAQALASYVNQLQKQIDKTRDLAEVEKARDLLKSLGVTGEIPQVQQMVMLLAAEADERQRGVEFAKAMNREMERQAELQRSLDEQINQFSGRASDALKQAQAARLEERLSMGEVFTPEELERTVKGIAGIRDEAEKTFDAASKSAERFAQNVQDALGDTVERTLRGDFDSIAELWGNLLIKMASQAIAADIGNALFGDLLSQNKTGDLGIFGSLVGSFFGLGPGRANGGTVQPWSVQRVNERGFEVFSSGGQDWLMTGGRGGVVSPSPAGGGVTVSVVQHITVGAGVSYQQMTAAMQRSKAEAQAAVYDAARRGFSPEDVR